MPSAAAVPNSNASQAAPTFSAGNWVGWGTYFGQLDQPTVNALADADINFKFVVADGQVTGGTFIVFGEGVGFDMAAGVTATMDITVSATLSGLADRVLIEGGSLFEGEAQSGGLTVPIEFSGEIAGTMEPAWATCTQAGGDFGTWVEQVTAASGVNVQADGVFVAKRVAESLDDPNTYIPLDWTKLVDDMQAAAAGPVTAEELMALVLRIEAVNAAIVGAAQCGVVPAGFEGGLVKDDYFYGLLVKILDMLLDSADATTYDHTYLLTIAARVGAVGPSAPDPASAAALLQKFEQVLTADLAGLDQKVSGSDEILEIYLAAKQAGLTELADAAKAKLQ